MNHPEWAHHLDFLGINYYRRFHVYHDNVVAASASFIGGAAKNDLFGESEPHGLLNDLGWEIYPQGLYDMIMRAKNQWNMPVLITENGLPERADRNRGPYIVAHVDQVRKAMQNGATVLGYMYWSLMDNWELQSNYQPESQFGLFHIDPAGRNPNSPNLHRELTEGALAYKELIDESEATDPAGAPTQAAVNSATARFGSIQPDGSAVIPPTQTHGRYWQGNGVNLYLGSRDADSAITGLIAFGSPGSLDWNRVDLVNDSSGRLVLRESWFDDATGTPTSRDHYVTYSNGTWTGTFTTGGQATTWTASPMPGTGLWQWAAGSPWGGSQFSVEDHEGHYAGKYLTFVNKNVPNAQPMGPMWRELAQVQLGQRLRLKAGDPAEPSLDLFDLSLDLRGSTQATTADLHSGTWTGLKTFNPFNPVTCALPFLFLCGSPLASTGYPPPVFFWTGRRDDNPASPFAFDEGSKVFLGYPASHPDVTSQYRKEHDPTSVMPLDNFQFTPLSIFPPALPKISFEAGGRAYSATTDISVCVAVSCTGSWHDIAGRVANRLPERFPPFADPGTDRSVEANAAIGGAKVQLDGSASFDLDGRPLTFTWTGDFGTVTSSTATVFLGLSPSGAPATHRVCLTVDNGVASATRCVNITVILAPGDVACPNGFLGVLHVAHDLIIPAGSSCGLTEGSAIGNNVYVYPHASFYAGGTTIGYSLLADQADLIELGDVNNGSSDTIIGHDAVITGTAGTLPYGEFICQTRIGHDLVIADTAATATGWDIGAPEPANCGRNARYGPRYADTIGNDGIFSNNADAYLDIGSNQDAYNGGTGPGFGHDLIFTGNHEGYNDLTSNTVGYDCNQSNNHPYLGTGNTAAHDVDSCNSTNP